MWRLDPAALTRAAAYRSRDRLVPGALRADPIWNALRATATAIDDRAPVSGRIERRDGSVVDCATVPLPGRRHAGHLPGRDRQRQRRARAARAQRGAGGGRQDQDRLRPPRLLRAALAAHQHHRLLAFPRRSRDRPADREAARISELHHHLDQCAARDHQQHPRSRHHRRRRDDAQSRPGRYPPHHGGRRRRRAGPAGADRHLAADSAPPPTSAASSPTSAACGRRCSISWPMP